MRTTEFSVPGPGTGITSRIEINRAKPVVVRNSIFVVALTMSGGVFAAIISVCMVILIFSELVPIREFTLAKARNSTRWLIGAVSMGCACPWLWNLGRAMAGYRIRLDARGADFKLGTKEKPQDLFLSWDKIAAIRYKRIGIDRQYFVEGTDGSEVRFGSRTFFRPRKVACLIAARTGQTIEEAS